MATVAFVCGLKVTGMFASGDHTIMARAAETDDVSMVNFTDTIECYGVMAIFTYRSSQYM